MSNTTKVVCSYLHTNPPLCDDSYAVSLGTKFDAANILYAVVVAIVLALAVVCTVVLIKRKKLRPFDTQKRIFMLVDIVVITLVVRCFDPSAYRLWIPYVVILLAYDWASSACYSINFIVLHDWIRIVTKVSGRHDLKVHIDRFFKFLHFWIWISWTATSLLQSLDGPRFYLWRALKLFSGAASAFLILLLHPFFGGIIYRVLKTSEEQRQQITDSRPASRSSSTDSLNTAAPSTGKARLSGKKRKSVTRIRNLLIVVFFVELAVIIAQVVSAFGSLSDKYTWEQPAPPPETFGDILSEFIFDIAQTVIICVTMYFFRPVLALEEKEGNDNDNENTEIRKPSRKATRATSNLNIVLDQIPEKSTEQETTTTTTGPPLPPISSKNDGVTQGDWSMHTNDEGLEYYHNTRTGQSVWQPPPDWK